jgi:hypothetical protein
MIGVSASLFHFLISEEVFIKLLRSEIQLLKLNQTKKAPR